MSEVASSDGLAGRLRRLQHLHDWTIKEMAGKSGLPKRSLENYMRKELPQLPGLEAIIKMSQGFDVSLDWLLLGQEQHKSFQSLMAKHCALLAALPYLQSLSSMGDNERTRHLALEGGKIMGMTPETLAHEIAAHAGRHAAFFSGIPTGIEEMQMSDEATARADADTPSSTAA